MWFRCSGGNGTGDGATITVTYSEEFYGVTLTATNGVKTVTKVAPSTGSVDIDVPEGGSWVISATVGGETYSSKPVVVELEYATVIETIPNGSTVLPTDDIQTWLKCAGITDKTTYTTLADVLADTETFIALCADSNACDYMARSTTWASGVAADSTAMLIVGKYNYCANALLDDNTWETAIRNSPYSDYVNPDPSAGYIPLVPKMTSNTTPSGECISISEYSSSNKAYFAFDGDAESTWTSASTTVPVWLGYHSPQPIIVSGVKVRFGNNIATNVSTTFKLQYSDTGNNDDWTDIGNAITTTATTEQFYTFENSTAHPYHHIYITAQTLNNANYKGAISTLQFYRKPSSTDVVIHSAVEDNIFYMDDGSPVALCGIPVGDTIDVDMESFKGQTLTLVSTVAKDPTNLSNDFTMPIRITPNITEIYLMPVGALYWWGSVNSDLENGTSANGWNQGGYTFSNPTYNKNEITLSSSLNHVSAIGSKTQISGTCKAIMQGVTADSGIYGYITPTASKATIDTSGITYIQSNTVSLYTKTTSSQYIYIGCANARSTKVKALWLE